MQSTSILIAPARAQEATTTSMLVLTSMSKLYITITTTMTTTTTTSRHHCLSKSATFSLRWLRDSKRLSKRLQSRMLFANTSPKKRLELELKDHQSQQSSSRKSRSSATSQ